MMDSPSLSFCKRMPLIGEGIITVNRIASWPFSIKIQEKSDFDDGISVTLKITETEAKFVGTNTSGNQQELRKKEDVGYDSKKKVSYWFSFNRDNRVLKYGKGYTMEATTLMKYTFKPESSDLWDNLFNPTTHKFIQIAEYCRKNFKSLNDVEKSVAFTPHPLVKDWPYIVKDSKTATMFDMSSDKFILSASLPSTCRELYQNVASPDVDLDWSPKVTKYKLSDAIGYSIATEGKLLNKKLKAKGEKGDMKYLRVTLGYDHGSSPGIPYVLELWPAGSESPIHNHGNSYAVIKVVYGSINIGIYNKTLLSTTKSTGHVPLTSFTASKGDVTWLSPNWYQTHQLRNNATDVLQYCATIQCYKYGQDDELMWPYFDYLEDKHVKEFKPHTDFEFCDMRDKVLKEYTESQGH